MTGNNQYLKGGHLGSCPIKYKRVPCEVCFATSNVVLKLLPDLFTLKNLNFMILKHALGSFELIQNIAEICRLKLLQSRYLTILRFMLALIPFIYLLFFDRHLLRGGELLRPQDVCLN